MPWITKEGRTVEEAQDAAIAAAGLPPDELDIEVVNEGAKGLFGLGGEPAVVRVRPKSEATDFRGAFRDDITPAGEESTAVRERTVREEVGREEVGREEVGREEVGREEVGREEVAQPLSDAHLDRREEEEVTRAPLDEADQREIAEQEEDKRPLSERQEEAAQLGAEIVRGILERMELEGDINTRVAGGTVYIEVFGEEMGILIGRSGATLEALQELVRAGIQRRLKTRQAVVVDVEAYWERRRKPQRGRDGDSRRGGGQRRGRRESRDS